MGALAFVSDGQAAVAEEPSDRPLDLPAVPTKAFAGLDAWPRDPRDESSLAQPGQVFGGELCFGRAEFDGPAPPWSPTGSDGGGAEDERLEDASPFGASGGRVDVAEVQSTSPRAPSSSNAARCSRRHRPTPVHTVERRRAVAEDVPNVGGRCRQAQPLVSTYTTAVNTARSSRGAVPPPCGRAANDGSYGATSSQSSSGTRRFDRSAPAASIMPLEHQVTLGGTL